MFLRQHHRSKDGKEHGYWSLAETVRTPDGPKNTMNHILLIEDDRDITELVRYNLQADGFTVTAISDGAKGYSAVKETLPDLLMLDLMLPGMPGLEICREIRKDPVFNSLPILILSARSEEADRVTGLEIGADDYVTKPFSVRELCARVKALLRRSKMSVRVEKIIESGALTIDSNSYRVTQSGRSIPLSVLEFRFLCYLAANPGRVFSRDQLLDAVWGTESFISPRAVDVCVRRLREKLEVDPENPELLLTIRGAGYKFSPV
jgi:DNA-binding response OmpR family regulator